MISGSEGVFSPNSACQRYERQMGRFKFDFWLKTTSP